MQVVRSRRSGAVSDLAPTQSRIPIRRISIDKCCVDFRSQADMVLGCSLAKVFTPILSLNRKGLRTLGGQLVDNSLPSVVNYRGSVVESIFNTMKKGRLFAALNCGGRI